MAWKASSASASEPRQVPADGPHQPAVPADEFGERIAVPLDEPAQQLRVAAAGAASASVRRTACKVRAVTAASGSDAMRVVPAGGGVLRAPMKKTPGKPGVI